MPDATVSGDLRFRLARLAFGAFVEREWVIGVVPLGVPEMVGRLLDEGRFPDVEVDWLRAVRPGRFVADPRAIVWNDEIWVLHELYLPYRGRGVVAAVQYVDGEFTGHRIVIDEPGQHLAYPTVVVDGDVLLCLPDAPGEFGVPVYIGDSPVSWRFAGHLDGVPPLTDPTLARLGERWLLLGMPQDHLGGHLQVFMADDVLGRWTQMRVDSSGPVECQRPGGPLVTLADGRTVRPAQDGRGHYGQGLVFQEVEIDGRRYRERPVGEVGAGAGWPFRDGFHTLTGTTELTVIDACQFRLTPSAGPRRLIHRVRG